MSSGFDEITVSSLSDLQLGSSSEYPSHLAPGSSGDQQQVQQRNSGSGAGNGNENNLNRQKRSSKHQQQQQQSVFNPSRHLDVWLANAIRGLENANSGGQDGAGSDLLDSPTLLKGSFGEPLSLPPNLEPVKENLLTLERKSDGNLALLARARKIGKRNPRKSSTGLFGGTSIGGWRRYF
uniref:(northern house mosquito) hypothetical protein n=1 Tax=Culex pipiens TaxID=7175 RepID=A0A8D8BBC4_CULPI